MAGGLLVTGDRLGSLDTGNEGDVSERRRVKHKVTPGSNTTKRLGTGRNPEICR